MKFVNISIHNGPIGTAEHKRINTINYIVKVTIDRRAECISFNSFY